ncbi:MAG: hypothetical protein IJU23_05705, partial [Proteobacteria bacterium]|nr:hypothetical protein [Pseudomonadota bacterium]
NDWARKFSDDHPVDQPVKKMFSILLGCLGVGGFAFWSVLLLQVFRRRTVEYEEYMEEHKFEFEETDEDKKKMEMLKEHLKGDDKSKGAKNANDVPEAPKELIMKKRAPSAALEIDTGASFNMNNMNVDNLGADNAGANDLGANTMGEAQAPIAPQEHEFVFDAEKKNQSIDMNFSLDVDALAQTLEAETGGEGKRRKRAHNSILEYYDDLAAAKKEEPIFEEGAGSLSSTLESLLDGFSKDDIK